MLATDGYMVLLRILHIATGVIWVGSLFVVVVFVQPSAATLGPAGAPFMSELRRRRFVDVVFVDRKRVGDPQHGVSSKRMRFGAG